MVRQGVGTAHFLARCANPLVEATLLLVFIKANEKLQGWVHVEVNRKCDSLPVQTNTTRDHRQISLREMM